MTNTAKNVIQRTLGCQFKGVRTHAYVDLDAAMSCALWRIISGDKKDPLFLPAGEPTPEGYIGLDVADGLKGLDTSCFEELFRAAAEAGIFTPQLLEEMWPLIRHVTMQDRGEMFDQPKEILAGNLTRILASLRGATREYAAWEDASIVTFFHRFLLNQIAFAEKVEEGRQAVAASQILPTALGTICVLPRGNFTNSEAIAFEEGHSFLIYQNYFNIGVVRNNKLTVSLAELLHDLPEGWYKDPRGFLVCWGSRKNPAKTASDLSVADLAFKLVEAIRKIQIVCKES